MNLFTSRFALKPECLEIDLQLENHCNEAFLRQTLEKETQGKCGAIRPVTVEVIIFLNHSNLVLY
jgi:hypothetical protein